MKLSELGKQVGFTQGHMTDLARRGKIPGCRKTKGGHWRIWESKKLAVWIGNNYNPSRKKLKRSTPTRKLDTWQGAISVVAQFIAVDRIKQVSPLVVDSIEKQLTELLVRIKESKKR